MLDKQLETTFDPAARYVDPQTGLEYENAAEWMLREPRFCQRNIRIRGFIDKKYPKHAIEAYWKAWDACDKTFWNGFFKEPADADRHEAGLKAGQATGCWGSTSFDDQLDAIRYGVLSGNVKAWSKQLAAELSRTGLYSSFLGVDAAKLDDRAVVRILG